MNDVLLPVCQRYNANLVTFEGEVSITAVCVNLMRRIDDADKPARIFYISDFDPAGNSMPVAMSRKLEFALNDDGGLVRDVCVKPLALTADQVKRYRLPRIPIKETERRAGKFEAAFGSGAVELDALEALYPGTLANIVDKALREYYSIEARRETARQREALQQAVNEEIAAITARYQDHIDALKQMQTELANIDIDASQYAVERYEPDVDYLEDRLDWLFDNERTYISQLKFYKAHKGESSLVAE